MSKPKFQTEWEEIDEEYQQLQVTQINSATPSRVSFGPGSSQMALAARYGSSYVTLDSSFPFVIHSRPGRKRSIEPVAGFNI